MKYVQTKYLKIALFDEGPKSGHVVFLLHGWPDDATSWHGVAPHLHRAGFRTIAPMLRGFGQTRFLSPTTRRSGNAGVLAWDVIDLAGELGVDSFSVAGHDWGSTVAEYLAIGWPSRVNKIAMIATTSRMGGLKMPGFEHASRLWYQWFQATHVGERAIRKDPRGFARMMWEMWSPAGWFDEAMFQSVSRSFLNPDWVDVTLNSYRSRWGEDSVDRRGKALEDKVPTTKSIDAPAVFFHGAEDGVVPLAMSADMHKKFSGPFERVVLPGAGHFLTRERPEAIGKRIAALFSSRATNKNLSATENNR